jgi:hypothetical protein
MCQIDWLAAFEAYQHYLLAELAWSALAYRWQSKHDKPAAGSLTGIYYPREV